MNIIYSKGSITEPVCILVSTQAWHNRKHSIHSNILTVIPIYFICINRFICEALSNAFLKSKYKIYFL